MRGDDLAIAPDLLDEVSDLLVRHGVPRMERSAVQRDACRRIVMVSTHGYWGDPPPAGATDTGGQTLYVLQISKECARAGREVMIVARWFAPYARIEQLEPRLWLVRIPAGGDRFIRKEELHPLLPELAGYATAVAAAFSADAVMGHYADGMVVAAEIATRLDLPFVAMPHSLALTKLVGLGLDPQDLTAWFDNQYGFAAREEYEVAALAQADAAIGCLPDQLDVLPRIYGLRTRRQVITPGIAPTFLEVGKVGELGDDRVDPELPARFGLRPGQFLIVTSRLVQTKNIAGAVELLGEVRALAPARFGRVALAVVGGHADLREPEELAVEDSIAKAMARHHLHGDDVRRIPPQPWAVIAQLLRQSLFYVGMQRFEPFGMGAAEALAVGVPVLLSRYAGIARALERSGPEPPCALLVDPDDPRGAAGRLIAALAAPAELRRMADAGRRFAQTLSWPNGAAKLLAILDDLVVRGPSSRQRALRGQHRLASAWRGDRPRIATQHAWSAEQLVPRIVEMQRVAARAHRRLIVAIGGESGAGKTEIAHCLGVALRRHRLWSALLPGDVFFRRPPRANHEARLDAHRAGRLADYIGPPHEIDLDALDRVLGQAADPQIPAIVCPSDCRAVPGLRYPRVPLDLSRCQIVLVDLTYAMLLGVPDLRIFLESDYRQRCEYILQRNAARDPDQDFSFVAKVLAIEHEQIRRTAVLAHVTVDITGALRDAASAANGRRAAGAQE
ncbi:MAG TPA: glycosyltransferase [Kofleriaceae bacterium]|nr:glycosyltransferase [Kofleriaceae bacterium]